MMSTISEVLDDSISTDESPFNNGSVPLSVTNGGSKSASRGSRPKKRKRSRAKRPRFQANPVAPEIRERETINEHHESEEEINDEEEDESSGETRSGANTPSINEDSRRRHQRARKRRGAKDDEEGDLDDDLDDHHSSPDLKRRSCVNGTNFGVLSAQDTTCVYRQQDAFVSALEVALRGAIASKTTWVFETKSELEARLQSLVSQAINNTCQGDDDEEANEGISERWSNGRRRSRQSFLQCVSNILAKFLLGRSDVNAGVVDEKGASSLSPSSCLLNDVNVVSTSFFSQSGQVKEAVPVKDVCERVLQRIHLAFPSPNASPVPAVMERNKSEVNEPSSCDRGAKDGGSKRSSAILDKSKLFSHMEDAFAKDTQQTLKSRTSSSPKKRPNEDFVSHEGVSRGSKDSLLMAVTDSENFSSSSAESGSLELTKSLRQIRFRKSLNRTEETNEMKSDFPAALSPNEHQTSQNRESSHLKTTLKIVRPKLVNSSSSSSGSQSGVSSKVISSPSKVSLERASSPEISGAVTSPLRIEIPMENENGASSEKSRSLLVTPATRRHSLIGYEVEETRICQTDAETATSALLLSPVLKIVVNGNTLESSSAKNEHHSGLRTVIRIPPPKLTKLSSNTTNMQQANVDDSALSPKSATKRSRIFGLGAGGNVSARKLVISPNVVTKSALTDPKASTPIATKVTSNADQVDRTSPSSNKAASQLNAQGRKALSSEPKKTVVTQEVAPDAPKVDDKLAESMVVPEKASSFNIHPERCCSDMCHYCGMKFGILDTPLHVSQLKTPAIQQFASELAGITSDACLCDKCFRYIDRAAKMKNEKRRTGVEDAKGERMKSCLVRNCNREVSHSVSKKWLLRLRKKLSRKVTLNWERVSKGSAKSSFAVCHKHNALIESYSLCCLCKRKPTIGGMCFLGLSTEDVGSVNKAIREDGIPCDLVENAILCKHCKAFCMARLKPGLKEHKAFCKEYRKKLHDHLGIDDSFSETSDVSQAPKKIHQVSHQSDNPTKITIKTTTLDTNSGVVSAHGEIGHDRKKRKPKEFASPNAESRIFVEEDLTRMASPPSSASSSRQTTVDRDSVNSNRVHSGAKRDLESDMAVPGANGKPSLETSNQTKVTSKTNKCSVTIQFDVNTKKLWQDLHHPYGNYTSLFRHLILLEKYWRNGDLCLSENSSPKASVYIRSVRNRINAYELKNRRSEEDLSEDTRPDLSVPAAPDMLHHAADEGGEEKNEESATDEAVTNESTVSIPPPPVKRKDSDATILKIPKVTASKTAGIETVSSSASTQSLPTKIRVRTDLMHLGLMEKKSSNNEPVDSTTSSFSGQSRKSDASFNIVDLVAKTTQSPTKPNSSNLVQILNDQPKAADATASGGGPLLGRTSLISTTSLNTHTTSVNSHVFNKATTETSSSAIPLTFNHSIAEVLAATAATKAAGQVAKNSDSSTEKPEVTITTKKGSSSRSSLSSEEARVSFQDAHKLPVWPTDKQMSRIGTTMTMTTTTTSSTSSVSSLGSFPPTKSPHPLKNMSELLQNQPPCVAPHLVAQNTLTPTTTKTMSMRNPGMLANSVRPVQLNSNSGGSSSSMRSLNPSSSSSSASASGGKKSLNTVLDRLTERKSAGVASSSGGGNVNVLQRPVVTTSKTSTQNSSGRSSLVQQLQAPPGVGMARHSSSGGLGAVNLISPPRTSSQQIPKANDLAAAAAAAAMLSSSAPPSLAPNAFMGPQSFASSNPASLVNQPMSAAAQLSSWMGQAQAAILMAGAGLPPMSQVQAMQELMKLTGLTPPTSADGGQGRQQQQRIRAPPPLTHMGARGHAQGNKPKE